jgi:hypothetical protein
MRKYVLAAVFILSVRSGFGQCLHNTPASVPATTQPDAVPAARHLPVPAGVVPSTSKPAVADRPEAVPNAGTPQQIRRIAGGEKAIPASSFVLSHFHVVEVSLTKCCNVSSEKYGGSKDTNVAELLANLQSAQGASATRNDQRLSESPHDRLAKLIEALCKDSLATSLAAPNLLCASGRPAHLLVGGEIPCRTKDAQGNEVVNFKEYGTRADVVAQFVSGDRIHLDLRIRLSEPDAANSLRNGETNIPALKVREMETALEFHPGQTFVLDGGVEKRKEVINSERKGVHAVINRVQMFVLVRAEKAERDPNHDRRDNAEGAAASDDVPARR